MHVKMLLMDEGGGNKKRLSHSQSPESEIIFSKLGFFFSLQDREGKTNHRSCGSVLCLLGEVSKMCFLGLDVRGGRVRTMWACVVNY